MWAVRRIPDRIAHERRKQAIRRFHRLYYESPWQTWKNTRWLGVNAYKTPLDLWIYPTSVRLGRRRPLVALGPSLEQGADIEVQIGG